MPRAATGKAVCQDKPFLNLINQAEQRPTCDHKRQEIHFHLGRTNRGERVFSQEPSFWGTREERTATASPRRRLRWPDDGVAACAHRATRLAGPERRHRQRGGTSPRPRLRSRGATRRPPPPRPGKPRQRPPPRARWRRRPRTPHPGPGAERQRGAERSAAPRPYGSAREQPLTAPRRQGRAARKENKQTNKPPQNQTPLCNSQ